MPYGHLKPLTEAELAVLAGGPVRKRDFDDASRWKVAKDKYYFLRQRQEKLAVAELPLGAPQTRTSTLNRTLPDPEPTQTQTLNRHPAAGGAAQTAASASCVASGVAAQARAAAAADAAGTLSQPARFELKGVHSIKQAVRLRHRRLVACAAALQRRRERRLGAQVPRTGADACAGRGGCWKSLAPGSSFCWGPALQGSTSPSSSWSSTPGQAVQDRREVRRAPPHPPCALARVPATPRAPRTEPAHVPAALHRPHLARTPACTSTPLCPRVRRCSI